LIFLHDLQLFDEVLPASVISGDKVPTMASQLTRGPDREAVGHGGVVDIGGRRALVFYSIEDAELNRCAMGRSGNSEVPTAAADVLCTRNKHLYDEAVVAYCREHAVEIRDDVERLRRLREGESR